MTPHDRDPDMAAATGMLVGLAIGVPITVGIIAAVAAWGGPALQYVARVLLIIREYAA